MVEAGYPYDDQRRDDILAMVPDDGKVIGSIGCGYAATEAELIRRGREVHGADTSNTAIAVATARLTSARVIQPADRNIFQKSSLDGLILADVLEHIPQGWDALRCFAEYVRPGGWVIISVPNMRQVDVLVEFILRGDWPERPTGIFDATHLQVMSPKRLQRWCTAAGLQIERWFDKYDPNGPRRTRFFRTLDAATFRLAHGWLTYQLQVRCRKSTAAPSSGNTAPPPGRSSPARGGPANQNAQ